MSGAVQAVSDVVHNVTSPIIDPVVDTVSHVSDVIAKDPLLSTGAAIALTAAGVPAPLSGALVAANAGASPENIAKAAALGYVGGEIAQNVAPEIAAATDSKVLGQIAGQAAGSATNAALTGRDPIQAATNALITGGINAGTSEVLGQVEGFSDLTPTQQRAVSSAVSAELQGKDPTAALIRGAINIGREKVQDEIKYAKYEDMDFGVSQGTVDKLAELQAREVEAEDAARAAAEQRLAEEENIRQIEAARAEQGATDTTINTEPAVDESYLSNLSLADLERYKAMQAGIDTVPDIKPQDLGISQESIDSYERTQQENADAGKLPSQWVPNQDGSGTSTMVHDDGSTTTIDDKGDIVYTTEAPPGSLISDKVTDETFTKLSTTQKSTALDMVKSGIPMNQAVKYVNSMGQTVSQPTQQVQQTQQTSSGTALSPLSPQYLTSTANKQGFVNPLSTYQRMVASDTAPLQPNPTQDTVQVSQGNVMPDYYSYGQNQSIDDILGITAKEGGLVTPLMAKGGSVQKYAEGGLSVPMMNHGGKMRGDFRHGAHVAGPGDGQSDDIPAMLADGEYVLDSEIVAALGNGSTKAGSKLLDKFRQEIRAHKRSGSINSIPPKSKSPLQYLADAKKKMDKK